MSLVFFCGLPLSGDPREDTVLFVSAANIDEFDDSLFVRLSEVWLEETDKQLDFLEGVRRSDD